MADSICREVWEGGWEVPLVCSRRCPHVLSGLVCGHEQPLGRGAYRETQEAELSSAFPASSEDIFGTTALEALSL